jgi:hypothetical protein
VLLEFPHEVQISRSALLDALSALHQHSEALTIIGAHAVIERTKNHIGVENIESTKDADLGVEPELVAQSSPEISTALAAAGYELKNTKHPGIYKQSKPKSGFEDVTVDLIAPASFCSVGRRSARISGHEKNSVTRAKGIEMMLIDRDLMTIESLSISDSRTVEAYVAGNAALLCAKSHKVGERLEKMEATNGGRSRLKAKDVLDIYNILCSADPQLVTESFSLGLDDGRDGVRQAANDSLVYLPHLLVHPLITPIIKDSFLAEDGPVDETIEEWLEVFGYFESRLDRTGDLAQL